MKQVVSGTCHAAAVRCVGAHGGAPARRPATRRRLPACARLVLSVLQEVPLRVVCAAGVLTHSSFRLSRSSLVLQAELTDAARACPTDGKCPGGKEIAVLPARPSLIAWTSTDVATFVRELGGTGPRQSCPPTCPVLKLMAPAADAFASRGVDGRALGALFVEHAARLHGTTNVTSLPLGVPPPGAALHMQFMTRLRDAVRLSLKLEPPNRTDWLTA